MGFITETTKSNRWLDRRRTTHNEVSSLILWPVKLSKFCFNYQSEKVLVSNMFSFSNNVFCHIKFLHLIHIWFVLCKLINMEGLNFLPNNEYLDWSELKPFADDKYNVAETIKLACKMEENFMGKRWNCWLPAFSPIHTMLLSLLHQDK